MEVYIVVASVQRGSVESVQRVCRGVGIECKIDASIRKHLHSLIVALAVVDGVDTDGVDAKLLEEGDIIAEGIDVEKRISGISCATGLVCYSTDVKSRVASPESVASNLDLIAVSL